MSPKQANKARKILQELLSPRPVRYDPPKQDPVVKAVVRRERRRVRARVLRTWPTKDLVPIKRERLALRKQLRKHGVTA